MSNLSADDISWPEFDWSTFRPRVVTTSKGMFAIPPPLDLWQALAPIIDEQILQALRGMDDPDAERDQHDLDAIEDYCLTVEDLADWLVPEEPGPTDVLEWLKWEQRHKIRQRLLDEARRAREAT